MQNEDWYAFGHCMCRRLDAPQYRTTLENATAIGSAGLIGTGLVVGTGLLALLAIFVRR